MNLSVLRDIHVGTSVVSTALTAHLLAGRIEVVKKSSKTVIRVPKGP